jgi:hypothetical protein
MASGLDTNAQSAGDETQPQRQLVTISWEVDNAVRLKEIRPTVSSAVPILILTSSDHYYVPILRSQVCGGSSVAGLAFNTKVLTVDQMSEDYIV